MRGTAVSSQQSALSQNVSVPVGLGYLLLPAVFLIAVSAFGQEDWQHYRTDSSPAFVEVKEAVHRMTSEGMFMSWDEKRLNRAGDLVSLALLQTLSDSEMTAPTTLKLVLAVIREGFACPSRCVVVPSDRQPKITMLLLEHLHNNTSGKAQSDVDETKRLVLQQTSSK